MADKIQSSFYEWSVRSGSIVAGGNFDIIFTTGVDPVTFKERSLAFSGGAGLTADVYQGVTYTGGSISPYFNLNLIQEDTGLSTIRTGITVTDTGTKKAPTSYYRGSTGVGNSSLSTFSSATKGRFLKPSTAYLLRITNTDVASQIIDVYLHWFEGSYPYPRLS